MKLTKYFGVSGYFKPGQGAGQFFSSILLWGIAFGCFMSVMNNYLVDVVKMSPFERGTLEFFREMPGLLLIFIIALMHRYSEWKIMKIGTLISMVGIAGLLLVKSPGLAVATLLIVLWSTGEHIMMPVRSSIAMHIARQGRGGRALGLVSGMTNAGNVFGSVLVALIFFAGAKYFSATGLELYNVVWVIIGLFLISGYACIARFRSPDGIKKRPRLYFKWKFGKFYIQELFCGARKQIFITFAPFVLIKIYGMNTMHMAILVGLCALLNIFAGPMIGKLTDRFGYRNVIICDTFILIFVCLIYGYANQIFPLAVAYWIVCLNFLFDAVISTASMATSMYVREISDSPDEVTSTLTTGISINHLISIFAALAGGLIWERFGFPMLFVFAAIMGFLNCAFAFTLPRPGTARQHYKSTSF